ncbi:MAG: hypothetical protein NDI90_20615 [Nitrospira sp. BO4]|jgi:hypothetical protein|nr:hypothetical protein [Nitrospira sp. BO4]
MASKKKCRSQNKIQKLAFDSFPAPVREFASRQEAWFDDTAAFRETLPIADRLATLLWSWPIRHAKYKATVRQLWEEKNPGHFIGRDQRYGRTLLDEERVIARRNAVYDTIRWLAENWYPVRPPYQIAWPEIVDRCQWICTEMLYVDDRAWTPGTDRCGFIASLIEDLWGAGEWEHRQNEQSRVTRALSPEEQLMVCRIGEGARDQAYLHLQTTHYLDSLRKTKENAASFLKWLHGTTNHSGFVKEFLESLAEEPAPDQNLTPLAARSQKGVQRFVDSFQKLLKYRSTVEEYLQNSLISFRAQEGRYRRTHAGKPSRKAWVNPAEESLRALELSPTDRLSLLRAWGLIPLELDLVANPRLR